MNFMDLLTRKVALPTAAQALPGRREAIDASGAHFVNGRPLSGPLAQGHEEIFLGLGCFWGAERKFWTLPGVVVTAVGYQGGTTLNPTYQEVCSGLTAHTEIVRVVYDPAAISLEQVLKVFWESHDPTQGMRQGNDVGTQYRSAIYTTSDAQLATAFASKALYQAALDKAGMRAITTEIAPAGPFYYAEAYHQQYLAKNPDGYCGLGGTGVSCPVPTGVKA